MRLYYPQRSSLTRSVTKSETLSVLCYSLSMVGPVVHKIKPETKTLDGKLARVQAFMLDPVSPLVARALMALKSLLTSITSELP